MKSKEYEISFRCYYENDTCTNHRQMLQLKDIPKWLESYRFTHPEVRSITVKIWFEN